jgi:galactokinase
MWMSLLRQPIGARLVKAGFGGSAVKITDRLNS